MEMKIEVIVIPVADPDRARNFYETLGWRADLDFVGAHGYRVIQMTPPGSGCSIIFGQNVTAAEPGSVQGIHLIVSDLESARAGLIERGVKVSEPFHDDGGVFHHADGTNIAAGMNAQRHSYASYASFNDPDGNGWILQEVTARLSADIKAGDSRFAPQLVSWITGSDASGDDEPHR